MEDRPQLPHLTAHAGIEGVAVGHPIGEVVAFERQPGGEARAAADGAGSLHLRRRLVLGEDLGGHREHLSRLDEISVFDVLRRPQNDDRMGEVLPEPDRPGRGLGHRLEHQHARHDGEAREMIREVFLRERQRLDRRDALAGFDGGHAVEQSETHEGLMATESRRGRSRVRQGHGRRPQYRESHSPHNSPPAPRGTTFSGLPS